MKEILALLLPPFTAFAGMRINELLFSRQKLGPLGTGLRFAFGLGTGMLVFSQLVVLGAVVGVNLAMMLAWAAMLWGAVELILRLRQSWPALISLRPAAQHWWWLALLPVAIAMLLTGLLATVEGTLEYDALAFWVFKAKVMFLKQGADFAAVHNNPLLTYAHWDYPLLVPGLYTLNYGLHGEVYEFTNKVWPFWMITALFISILSVARFAARPRLLPVAVITALCFVRATTFWVRMEGATIPLTFFTVMAALAAMLWLLDQTQTHLLGVTAVMLAGCFATKFEGAVNALMWSAAVGLILALRNEWRTRPLWVGSAAGALVLVPYALFRITGPLPHPQSSWLQDGLSAPGNVLSHFPATVLLSLGHRFFDSTAYSWKTDPEGHLVWAGQWNGLSSFVNEQTHVLAWLIVALTLFTWWRRPQARLPLGVLCAVLLATMLFICFVLSCLSGSQVSWDGLNEFTNFMVGRYFNPIMLAWFVGLMIPWLQEAPALTTAIGQEEPPEQVQPVV